MRVKSSNVMVTLTERVIVPLFALTSTRNAPADATQDRVELTDVTDPPRIMLLGLREQERPAFVEFVRLTVPANPFRAFTVMVEFA